ncbi:hypothetical protein DFH11DRAFT_1722376 [Phellopilus nigrolimitatus]|nr:hypothetical protein DFH11DRAFT_1722376 [Phellopilus nigrolimitatus]
MIQEDMQAARRRRHKPLALRLSPSAAGFESDTQLRHPGRENVDQSGDEANTACIAAKLALVAFSVHSSGLD